MALDKLIDSVQLDSDLTSVANAIRTKGGTSAQLAFPQGFVDAVDAIQTGGGVSWEDIATATQPSGLISLTATAIAKRAFSGFQPPQNWRVYAPNAVTINNSAFRDCTNLVSVRFPNATSSPVGFVFYATKGLVLADVGKIAAINAQFFNMANNLNTLIIRKSDGIVTLDNTNCFNSTYFASGNTGGTIYIPRAMYEHLGDGSTLDYKAATNWSVMNGYGTITWAQLEGSPYEDPYGDW